MIRRRFVACALCAVLGLAGGGAAAQTPPAGLKRTILRQTDGPRPGLTTLVVLVEIDGGATVARHTHPGIESAYVLEGSGTLSVEGQPDQGIEQGRSFQIPTGVPHAVQNGAQPMRVVATYVVEAGKPLASPAPA